MGPIYIFFLILIVKPNEKPYSEQVVNIGRSMSWAGNGKFFSRRREHPLLENKHEIMLKPHAIFLV